MCARWGWGGGGVNSAGRAPCWEGRPRGPAQGSQGKMGPTLEMDAGMWVKQHRQVIR